MTYKDCWEYILSDYIRYSRTGRSAIKVIAYTFLNHKFAYQFWLRLTMKRDGWLWPLAEFKHRMMSRRYGIEIPWRTKIGYGLFLSHGVGIIINETTVIGNNCNIGSFTTIGSNKGKAAMIGDNVWIGPSVCIVEDVTIGDDVTIGAGAVVTRNIPSKATVAGVPAKVLHYDNPGAFVRKRYKVRTHD